MKGRANLPGADELLRICTPDELVDLEHARLTLRRDYGVGADREAAQAVSAGAGAARE